MGRNSTTKFIGLDVDSKMIPVVIADFYTLHKKTVTRSEIIKLRVICLMATVMNILDFDG